MKYEAVFDIPDEIITNKDKLYCGAVVYEGEFDDGTEIISYEEVQLNAKEQPHGEWKHAIVDCYKSGYICPHCNGFAVIDGKSDGYSVTFCPNCGSNNRPKEGEAE